MKITDRNGKLRDLDKNRVYKAIRKAFIASNMWTPNTAHAANEITNSVKFWDKIGIEEIQDQVIELLKDYDYESVAEEYQLYRKDRALIRKENNKLIKGYSEKIEAKNIQNQNANVDEASFGGRKGEASDYANKLLALQYYVSEMAKENHEQNEIYIHDLGSFITGEHNCLTIPFDDLLAKGFKTKQTDVRPANSINTAFQLVAVGFQVQSLQQFGGVSASHLDWTMVPYYRASFYKKYNEIRDIIPFLKPINLENPKDTSVDDTIYKGKHWWNFIKRYCYNKALKYTNKELDQATEGMYHNLNTLQSRSGNQLPFTSINYGTCTLPEGRAVIKSLLNSSLKGVGKFHRTPIFPCGIFQIGEGINLHKGDPNYDLFRLALKSTAKRIYPNFANIDWSGNAGYDKNDPRTYFSTMGK